MNWPDRDTKTPPFRAAIPTRHSGLFLTGQVALVYLAKAVSDGGWRSQFGICVCAIIGFSETLGWRSIYMSSAHPLWNGGKVHTPTAL